MTFLQLGQYALASLELFGVAGNSLKVYQEPTWSSSDPSVLKCIQSSANPGYAEIQGLKLGSARLIADSGYDTGKGIEPWNAVLEIEVIDREVASGEIKLNYGEVGPIVAADKKAKAK